jgi:hypothetical protein
MSGVAEDEQYFTKSMANNVIKRNCTTPDTYRNLIKNFKENGIYYQTYQLKEERAYRVVLKHLHHTTEVEDIRQETFALGHVVRNIVNVHHRLTKKPLKVFFVDLQPDNNNKDIYNITAIQNKVIHLEPPITKKNHIPQCARCQQYGHTRTYCNKECSKRRKRQQNVPCVVEITLQTIKVVSITTTLSMETIHP